MKTGDRKSTPSLVHALVVGIPVLLFVVASGMERFEDGGKGPSFTLFIIALYTGGFAIVYSFWLLCAWLVSKGSSRRK